MSRVLLVNAVFEENRGLLVILVPLDLVVPLGLWVLLVPLALRGRKVKKAPRAILERRGKPVPKGLPDPLDKAVGAKVEHLFLAPKGLLDLKAIQVPKALKANADLRDFRV